MVFFFFFKNYLAIREREIGKTDIVLPPIKYSASALASFFFTKPKYNPIRMHKKSMNKKKQ